MRCFKAAMLSAALCVPSCADDEPPCTDLPVTECSAPRCRTLQATRIDVARMCVGQVASVGCMSTDEGCGQLLTLARDPTGNTWSFSDTCLPKGWTSTTITSGDMLYFSDVPQSWGACP